jgi:hypothetical protein
MNRLTTWVAASALLAGSIAPIHAQKPPAPAMPDHAMHGDSLPPAGGHMHGSPKAAPADVASPEAIVAAYYESLSGPAGKKRDWNRFLSLFSGEAHLLPAEGKGHAGIMAMEYTPQTYLYGTEPRMLEDGYVVKEVARKSEGFGKIQHVWSTYEGRHAAADPKPFVRGINSFQLFTDGKRWWIFDVIWQPETAKLALPAEYLH